MSAAMLLGADGADGMADWYCDDDVSYQVESEAWLTLRLSLACSEQSLLLVQLVLS